MTIMTIMTMRGRLAAAGRLWWRANDEQSGTNTTKQWWNPLLMSYHLAAIQTRLARTYCLRWSARCACLHILLAAHQMLIDKCCTPLGCAVAKGDSTKQTIITSAFALPPSFKGLL